MKSMFFKNLARGLVVVSAALALVNCNETTTAANDTGVDSVPVATGDTLDPALNPVVDPTLDPNQPVVDPANPSGTGDVLGGAGDPTDPTILGTDPDDDPCLASSLPDSCGTNPQIVASSSSAAVVTSSSSEELDPVSSSSEKKVESSSSAAKADGIFLATDTDENKDYMEVVYIKDTGWDGGGILAYPKRLSDTQKHGVVMWGPGGGTNPDAYGGMIRRLASHGFVVIALKESPGNTTQGKPALDWLENKNKTPGDPLYGKLDMTKVGCSGHSMGGLESEQMVINDSRVITAMLNNSGDLGHTAMASVPTNKTIGIVYGEGGMERPNSEADYNNPNVKAPACLIRMTGGKGNECQMGEYGQLECGWGHGSGSWGGMAATIAWMRWHLGGEDWRKDDFVGTSGKYINGPILGEQGNWKGTCKNF